MKISIITATYNSEKTVKDTIESVLSQKHKDIEYIIIDGDSNDSTVSIVKSYGNKITKFISEPDKGIYDAMNKGISLATGDIVGILNSDDIFFNDEVLVSVNDVFKNTETDVLYGDIVYVDKYDVGKVVRHWISRECKPKDMLKGWHPPHPSFFVKKSLYNKCGVFDLSFRISADFELMLRFIEKCKARTKYLKKTLVKMRMGGASNNSIKNIIIGNMNCLRAFQKNGLRIDYLHYPTGRFMPKIKQYLFR